MSAHAHAVVVGAGLSGLSAALWLRAAGYDVTVVERAERPGGLVRTETLGGHLFDTGATVLTMPELVAAPLRAVGMTAEDIDRELGLIPVDPTYVTRFADGSTLDVRRDAEDRRAAVQRNFGAAAATGVAALEDWLRRLYDAEFSTFIDHNLSRPGDLIDVEIARSAQSLVTMGALRRLTPAVRRFVADTRLQRVFTFQSLYAGVPPQQANAVYGVIAHMDIGRGVVAPAGGMGRVGAVLADALRRAGGRIYLGTTATALHRDGHWLTGVSVCDRSGGTETIAADAVIATTPVATVSELLGDALPAGPRWRRIRHSPSAVVLHGVVPRSVTSSWPSGHHTVDFGAAWSGTFRELTRPPGRPMSDPSFLITRPAVSDPAHFSTITDDGPVESVSVLAPTPNLAVADLPWDYLADAYADECLHTLDARGYHGISGSFRRLGLDHPHTWARAGLPDGTPFGAAHLIRQTGPLRTPNVWPGMHNLFLAGGATLPGVGIPPVLVSGHLAARRVLAQKGVASTRSRPGGRPMSSPDTDDD